MTDSNSASARVIELADEFLDRYRRGERPPLGEYTARYPELADEIREVFSAMAIMERIALADESIEGRRLPPGPSRPREFGQLGDFRILREVGRGGMGVVFEAEQVSLGRHVALKVLPERLLADPKQRGRFEREAKAAARLHHTNIVPVFGVGEDEGTPYYSMQFIAGLGLDQVIRELKRQRGGPGPGEGSPVPAGPPGEVTVTLVARSLLAGRLEAEGHAGVVDGDAAGVRDGSSPPGEVPISSSGTLLGFGSGDGSRLDDSPRPTYWRGVARIGSQVADALAYAHSQGILHRDIKPSNLLIDAHGIVWVTDFGLAKVEDQEGLTHTGDILGTLRYMPPEAFEGRHDARGDVYSLGLSLYEMLAFRPAYDEVDRHRLVRQVTTGEPLQLRTLNPEVPRDLETVIHKAIEREPSHRYQTAAALAEDLRRYMEDRPILARRASESEKLRRWCRRNPTPAVLLATLFVVFWAGFGLVAWKWREAVAERQKAVQSAELAERQRGRAEDREAQAIEAVKRFRDAVANEPELKNNPALEALRKRLLGEPLAFFKGLRGRLQVDQDTRPESLYRLANACNELGELTSQIDDKGEALIVHGESLAIARKLVDDHPEVAEFQGLLAETLSPMGKLLGETGKHAEAHEAFESALAIRRKLAGADPSVTRTQLALAGDYFNMGNLLRDTGKHAESLKAYESALAISQPLAEANPSVADFQQSVAAIYNSMGILLRDTGKHAESLKAYESTLAIARKLTEARPSNGYHQEALATGYVNSGAQLKALGKLAEAIKANESGLATYRKLVEANPSVTQFQNKLAACYLHGGILLKETGKPAEAVKAYESALAIFRELAQAYPSVTEFQYGLASTYKSLGKLLDETGKSDEARKAFESGLAVVRKLAEAYPSIAANPSLLAEIYNELGKLLVRTGKPEEAWKAYESELAIRRKLAKANPSVAQFQQELASCCNDMGNLLSQAGKPAEARKAFESGLAIYRKLAEAYPSDIKLQDGLAVHHLNLAKLLSESGKPAEAFEEDESGLAIYRKLVEAYPSAIEFQKKLAAGYLNSGVHLKDLGKPAEALKAFESAVAIFRKLAEANPTVTEFQLRVAGSYNNLGLQLSQLGKTSEARKAFESALPIFRKLVEEKRDSPELASNMGAILDSLAQLDLSANRFLEARDRYREAIDWQGKALAVHPANPAYRYFMNNHLFNLRLAAQRLNDAEGVAEAERELTNLRHSDPSIIALDARLAAILKGERQPDGEADRLALAQRAYEKALYATAVRLLSEALAANPALANNPQTQPRYNAACSAALAGCGKSKDDPPPDDDAQAKFRKQALDWLNLELATWSKIVEVGPPQARPFVIQTLTHWKKDPDLAGIRDAEALKELSDGERAAFQKVWTDVEALLKKAAGGQ